MGASVEAACAILENSMFYEESKLAWDEICDKMGVRKGSYENSEFWFL